jgi:hypothetical protein
MNLSPHPEALLKLFVFIDDFVELIERKQLKLVGKTNPQGVKSKLSVSELITLSIYRYVMRFQDWKNYWKFIEGYHEGEFEDLPDYSNFLVQQKQHIQLVMLMLNLLMAMNRVAYTKGKQRIMFVDTTDLPVCTNKREFTHKVCRKHARKGKTTKGWFYGFKLHLVCDLDGNLLSIRISAGNVDGRPMLGSLLKELMGLLVADAGYISSKWFAKLRKQDIHLFNAVKANMKKLMTVGQHQLLKLRQRVESVFSILKLRLGLVSTLPRSVEGYQFHYLMVCLTYCVSRLGNLALTAGHSALSK